MSARSWNPIILVSILIAATLLISLHCYSLRQQITDLHIQAAQYRKLVERLSRQKTEMRLNLGHLQRAMEKHTQRAKQRFDFEETLRTKEALITHLKNQMVDLKKDLESYKSELTKSKTSEEHHKKSSDLSVQAHKESSKDQFHGQKLAALSNLNKKADDSSASKESKDKTGDLAHNAKDTNPLKKDSASIVSHTLKFVNSTKSEAGLPKNT